MDARKLTLTLWLIAALITAGCKSAPKYVPIVSLPADEAPRVPLQFASMSDRTQRTRIHFEDMRPDREKLYYPGSDEPQRWRDAISMLPMESFQPGIEERLATALEAQFESEPGVLQGCRLQITSFQMIYDERKVAEADFDLGALHWKTWQDGRDGSRDAEADEEAWSGRRRERELERERDARHEMLFGDAPRRDRENFGESIAGDLLSYVASTWFRFTFVKAPRTVRRKLRWNREYTPLAQSTPEFITDASVDGLTCRLEAVAKLNCVPVPLTVVVARNEPVDRQQELEPQLARIVAETIRDFVVDLSEQSASASRVRMASQPDFVADEVPLSRD